MVALLCVTISFAQNAERKKIGLVLGGGGAKGAAHIGAIKVIEEAGIPIDYIAGTSIGALIGALYSIGYTSHELETLIKSQEWKSLLSDKVNWKDRSQFYKMYGNVYTISVPMGVNRDKSKRSIEIPTGFIKGQNITSLFSELTIGYHSHTSFDSLPIPFACVAADISTGKEYVFREGILQQAMRASMSIPGAFEPVPLNDTMLLIDGGVINNFPTDIVKEMGADIIIGIDLDNGYKQKEQIKNVVDIFEQLNEMLGYDNYEKNKKLLDIHIHPNLKNYSMASFNTVAIDSMLLIGEREARNHWDELIALKKRAGIEDDEKRVHIQKHKISTKDTLNLNSITFDNIDKGDEKWIKRIAQLKNKKQITPTEIEEATNRLYATGNYSQVLYSLNGEEPYDLTFTFKERAPSTVNLGFRFDSEVYAALLLNTTIRTPRIKGAQLSLSGRLGENPWGEISISFGDGFLNKMDLGYRIHYNDFHLYQHNKRMASLTNLNHRAYLKMANISRGNMNIQAGLRYDYYHYKNIITVRDSIHEDLHASGSFLAYIASLTYNSTESNTFPKKGTQFKINYELLTSNFAKLYNKAPAHILSYKFKHYVRITNSVHLIPQIDGRIIFKNFKETPIPFLNYIGGNEDGRYSEQQLSMPGIKFNEIAQNSVLKLSADLRYNIGRGHYAELGASYLLNKDNFRDMIQSKGDWSMKAKYSYNAIFGPISVTYAICSKYWDNTIYIGIGHYF